MKVTIWWGWVLMVFADCRMFLLSRLNLKPGRVLDCYQINRIRTSARIWGKLSGLRVIGLPKIIRQMKP